MLQRIKQVVRRDNKSILLAALLSAGFFVGKLGGLAAPPHLLARQSVLTVLLFFGLFVTFCLFSRGVSRHVVLEMVDGSRRTGLWSGSSSSTRKWSRPSSASA